MSNFKKKVRKMLRELNMIHTSFLLITLTLAVAAYFIVSNGHITANSQLDNIVKWFLPLLIAISIMGGFLIFQQLISKIKKKDEIEMKIQRYKKASLIKYIFIQVPIIIAIVCYMLTTNAMYVAFAIVAIILFYFIAPRRSKIIRTLHILN